MKKVFSGDVLPGGRTGRKIQLTPTYLPQAVDGNGKCVIDFEGFKSKRCAGCEAARLCRANLTTLVVKDYGGTDKKTYGIVANVSDHPDGRRPIANCENGTYAPTVGRNSQVTNACLLFANIFEMREK